MTVCITQNKNKWYYNDGLYHTNENKWYYNDGLYHTKHKWMISARCKFYVWNRTQKNSCLLSQYTHYQILKYNI